MGLWVQSLALLTDAIHLTSDIGALIVGLVAIKVRARAARPVAARGPDEGA